MNFGEALYCLKVGNRVQRAAWKYQGMWLEFQRPDANSKMGHPYIYMTGVDGKPFPWTPNQLDLLADDWEVVYEGFVGGRL